MTRSAIRWPAEWERHRGTLMAWPHDPDTWPGAFDAIPDQYERLVREIARFEPVWLLAGNETAVQQAQQRFGGEHRLGQGNQIQDNQITVCDIPTNDVWTRDYGPTVVLDVEAGTRLAVDWIYNGWGGKYPPFDRDAAVARTFASRLELPICRPQVVLEGGAIEGNGQGTVLTTRSCLLNPNRNPGLSESQVTGLLRQNLGASTVVWLDGGDFCGDDTDGHIDQLARFTSESHIIYASCSEDDVNRPTLEQLERQLEQRLPNTDRIPIPVPQVHHGEQRLPASYCNFYVVHQGVLVPTFGVAEDDAALGILREQFPNREIVPFNCRELVWGLGAIHCMTQQIP
jgi:agmatine deiminase